MSRPTATDSGVVVRRGASGSRKYQRCGWTASGENSVPKWRPTASARASASVPDNPSDSLSASTMRSRITRRCTGSARSQ